jgi:hypothetical protein
MAEFREKLVPFKGKRIKVRGTLTQFSWWKDGHRDVGSACVRELELNDEVKPGMLPVHGRCAWLFCRQEGRSPRDRHAGLMGLPNWK